MINRVKEVKYCKYEPQYERYVLPDIKLYKDGYEISLPEGYPEWLDRLDLYFEEEDDDSWLCVEDNKDTYMAATGFVIVYDTLHDRVEEVLESEEAFEEKYFTRG